MIQSKDRTGYIGCSDTDMVMGNWKTKTFSKWFGEKVGLPTDHFQNKYTLAGTNYEHKILEAVREMKRLTPLQFEMDKQIIIPELKIRANYDGTTVDTIYEVKTHKAEKPFKVSKTYWRQAQAEMAVWQAEYGFTPTLYIVSYPLTEEEYINYFRDIDREKLQFDEIAFDEEFAKEYFEKVKIIAECMTIGKHPMYA